METVTTISQNILLPSSVIMIIFDLSSCFGLAEMTVSKYPVATNSLIPL